MKKIDINKLKKITKLHLEYCKNLRPEIILGKRKSIDDELIKLLCCEYPFDFNKPEHNYLKDAYREFDKNSGIYNGRNIDYKVQYKNFRSKNDGLWNGKELLKMLDVNICPYCGMNYITSVSKKNGEIKTIASLDHYLPKNKYPFLAMNIYNLIPSCTNCNSIFKYQEEDAVIYPFNEALDDSITFSLKDANALINTIINLQIDTVAEIEILPKKYHSSEYYKRLQNHIKILALEERYNNFQNIAKSLIKKRHIYNRSCLEKIEKLTNLTKTQLENLLIKQDLLSNDEIFSKFKKDIWNQLSRYNK